MFNLDDEEARVLRDFLGENWAQFVAHCNNSADPGVVLAQQIYEAVGGEQD